MWCWEARGRRWCRWAINCCSPATPFASTWAVFPTLSYDDPAGNRKAFDVCPVNFVLNRLASRRGMAYDDGGRLARSGFSDEALLRRLDALPYYEAEPPKSLGQEWVDAEVMPLLETDMPLENLMATYTLHAARQIDRAIRRSVPAGAESCRVLVTGGGALNSFLVELMNRMGEDGIRYELPDRQLIDYKEALIFAFLGLLKWKGEINTLRSVTGASRDASGGAVYTF
jgi:anhydro-N-acetylmuramic acid kinase